MKKQLLLLCAFGICSATFARQPFKANVKDLKRPDLELIQGVLQKQFAASGAAKTTSLKKRLVANSYTTQGQMADSNHYFYSWGRGSSHTDPNSYYDNYMPTSYSDTRYVMCDRSIHWHDFGNGLDVQNENNYTHDANNKVTTMLYESPWMRMEYDITYTSTGLRNTLITVDSFGGTGFEPKSTRFFSYDSQNKLIGDSTIDIVSKITTGKNKYAYDAAGNLLSTRSYYWDGTIMLNYFYSVNTYDNSNRLITTITQYDFMATGLENNSMDTFGYTGTGTKYTYYGRSYWNVNAVAWDIDNADIYHYNAQEAVDTYYVYQWTGAALDTIERDVYTYNSDNLMKDCHGYEYNNGAFDAKPYDETKMYYEDYDPTGVKAIAGKYDGIVLYPNPAGNTLSISGGENSGNITILNALGQAMLQLNNASLAKEVINISNLPSGNYILTIQGEKGYVSQVQFTKI